MTMSKPTVQHKYSNHAAQWVDFTCYAMTRPWCFCLSSLLCCYMIPTYERGRYLRKTFDFAVLGPFYLLLLVVLSPMYLIGQTVWIIFCHFGFVERDYIKMSFSDEEDPRFSKFSNQTDFGFISGNLLLGFNGLGKLQNMSEVSGRLKKMSESFTQLSKESSSTESTKILRTKNLSALKNETSVNKNLCVFSTWRHGADFVLFQEVWDRPSAFPIIEALKGSFPYFVFDAANHGFCDNYCSGNSGLFFASRFPILEVDFVAFSNKKSWQRFISYGILFIKVNLGFDEVIKKRNVGFVANTHLMAYQEKENQLGTALTKVECEFERFRSETTKPEDKVLFAIVGGDLNLDNISPCDIINSDNLIFSKFEDPCVKISGKEDYDFAIGTEHRQLKVHDSAMNSPEKFRQILVDDVERRRYIIDADVEVQTPDLMFCDPKVDHDGILRRKPFGGMRRIDRILVDKRMPGKASGVSFYSTLASLTDHVPVGVTISTNI